MTPRCRSRWFCTPAHGSGAAPRLEGLRQGRSEDPDPSRMQASPAGPAAIMRSGPAPHAHKPFTVRLAIASRHTANKLLKDAGLRKAF
jgi:hypothetical protein